MTIARLARVSLAGPEGQRHATMAQLQALGVVHLAAPAGGRAAAAESPPVTADARTALRYLRDVKNPRRPAPPDASFTVTATVARVLANRHARRALQERIDHLRHRLAELEPWGDAVLPGAADLGGFALRRVRLTLRDAQAFQQTATVPWVEAGRDGRYAYLLEIGPATGGAPPESRPALALELAAAQAELEDLDAERVALTRWLPRIERDLARADDAARLAEATATLCQADGGLFQLDGWVARRDLPALETLAAERGLALVAAAPAPGDDPPTLLENRGLARGGERLLAFYSMPAYGAWDPSPVLAVAFALFFAMIIADAGYALLLWLAVGLGHGRLGATPALRDLRRLAHVTCALAVGYGILVGSYFGAPAPPGWPGADFPAALAVVALGDYPAMIRLSVLIGVGHVLLALWVAAARAHDIWSRLHLLGWSCLAAGGATYWLAADAAAGNWVRFAQVVLVLGGAGVVLGGGPGRPTRDGLRQRLGDGALALRNVTQLFGDVLSYLRLFALGLASSSLAATFNGLAAQAWSGRAGAGLLLALLVLVVGHGLNLVLALVSGVVHGLRLNYIEFLHWGETGEGHAFRPFRRQEIG